MKKRLLSIFILIAYCAVLVKVMVFKSIPTIRIGSLMLNFSGTESGHPPNFVPFKTILPYLLGYKGFVIASINLIGNIALLIPIGLLVPLVYPNITTKKLLLVAVASGLLIEVMQAVLNVGIFDIDDVILNALGVVIGYAVFVIVTRWIRAKNYKSIVASAIIVTVAAAAVSYVILPHGKPVVNGNRKSGRAPIDSINNKDGETLKSGNDPCGGTGGTGEIVSVGNNTITIRRNDGVIQNITIASQANIRTSDGPISKSDLKVGERVTLVIDASETASVVLVCNVLHPGAVNH